MTLVGMIIVTRDYISSLNCRRELVEFFRRVTVVYSHCLAMRLLAPCCAAAHHRHC